MDAGHHPRAAALLGGVGERDPAGEIALRLDEVVAVVLVPGKGSFGARLLVDRLVPVEAHVGTEQVAPEVLEHRAGAEVVEEPRAQDQVHRERDLVGARDEPLAALLAQRGLDLRLPRIDLGDDAIDGGAVERALEQEVAVLVPAPRLFGRDAAIGSGRWGPLEGGVARVKSNVHGPILSG